MGVILRLEDYLTAARKVIKSPVSATNRTLESLWFVVTEAEIVKKKCDNQKKTIVFVFAWATVHCASLVGNRRQHKLKLERGQTGVLK